MIFTNLWTIRIIHAKGAVGRGLLFLSILLPAIAGAALPDFEDIGISDNEMSVFLRQIRMAARGKNWQILCQNLAYPILVSNAFGSTRYTRQGDCIRDHAIIFSPALLRLMASVSMSELTEVKTQVMFHDGEFWISKSHISKLPQDAKGDELDFHNKKFWQLRITDINK
jgi:hypothetical protein